MHLKNTVVVLLPQKLCTTLKRIAFGFAGGFDRKKAWINYHRGQNELDEGQYLDNDLIEYAPTCCALIHRSVFEDIGLMDEKYFVYFDDTDFFFRVFKHGKHIKLVTSMM